MQSRADHVKKQVVKLYLAENDSLSVRICSIPVKQRIFAADGP